MPHECRCQTDKRSGIPVSCIQPTELRLRCTLLSYAALFWAIPHLVEPRCTLLSYRCSVPYLMYPQSYAATLWQSDLCYNLLSYAAPYWVKLHPTELTAPYCCASPYQIFKMPDCPSFVVSGIGMREKKFRYRKQSSTGRRTTSLVPECAGLCRWHQPSYRCPAKEIKHYMFICLNHMHHSSAGIAVTV